MKGTIDLREKGEENSKEEGFSWQADYEYQSSPIWREGIIILMMGVIIFSIIFNFGFVSIAFFVFLFIFLIVRIHFSDSTVQVSITNWGVRIGDRSIPYQEIKSFYVRHHPSTIQELSLEHRQWYFPYTKIPIHDQNPVQLRHFLLEYAPEMEHQDTLIDTIIRKIGL